MSTSFCLEQLHNVANIKQIVLILGLVLHLLLMLSVILVWEAEKLLRGFFNIEPEWRAFFPSNETQQGMLGYYKESGSMLPLFFEVVSWPHRAQLYIDFP